MKTPLSTRRKILLGFILTLTIASLAHRLLYRTDLWQSGAMFIGLPAIIGILIVLTAKPKTPTGAIVVGTCLFLLISGILLAEGFICILLASPIFLLAAVITGTITETFLKKRSRRSVRLNSFFVPVVLLMALEGAAPGLYFNRENTVSRSVEVSLDEATIAERLRTGFPLSETYPFFFKLGFPLPLDWEWDGEIVRVQFEGPEHLENTLIIACDELGPRHARFSFVEDHTAMPRWLEWKTATVNWEENANGTHTVTWTIEYERSLDPAWYFHPLERYGVGLAAEYLATALGTQ